MARRSRRAAWALLALLVACGEDRVIQALPPGYREDLFAQEPASLIDMLWVIDDSGSMQPRQQELSNSLARFMDQFSRGQVDYRIAVTTTDVFTDAGQFLGNPAIVEPSLPDPIAVFQRNVLVGTSGKGHEEGFEAARLAVEREKGRAQEVLAQRADCLAHCPSGIVSCPDDCARRFNPRFMRPEAHLYLVFVSDEEEQSFGEVRYYQRAFESALGLGNEGAVAVGAICGDLPTPPCGAEHGARYVALAQATGGFVGSICEESFEKHLERLAFDAAGLKSKFRLSRTPRVETLAPVIRYRCDAPRAALAPCANVSADCQGRGPEYLGVLCTPSPGETNGWTYEATTNAILFHGDAVPGLRSQLVVSYQADERTEP